VDHFWRQSVEGQGRSIVKTYTHRQENNVHNFETEDNTYSRLMENGEYGEYTVKKQQVMVMKSTYVTIH